MYSQCPLSHTHLSSELLPQSIEVHCPFPEIIVTDVQGKAWSVWVYNKHRVSNHNSHTLAFLTQPDRLQDSSFYKGSWTLYICMQVYSGTIFTYILIQSVGSHSNKSQPGQLKCLVTNTLNALMSERLSWSKDLNTKSGGSRHGRSTYSFESSNTAASWTVSSSSPSQNSPLHYYKGYSWFSSEY